MAGDGSGRVLGIDFGSSRVGVAVSDPLRVLARGVGTWANDAHLMDRLRVLIDAEEVTLIVVGMPYAPDGGIGSKGREVERFAQQVRTISALPLVFWDESRTSIDAESVLRESGMGQKRRRRKGRVDEMAARILLQQYLDAQQAPMRTA